MVRSMTETPKKPAGGGILLVEKDIEIRKMMAMALGDHFPVDAVGSAEAGLALVESEVPFDIVIAGNSLPGMSGVEFLRRVGEKQPESVRILMTGGTVDSDELCRAVSEGDVSRIVLMPFRLSTLLEQLKQDLSVKNDHPATMPVTTTVAA